MRKVATDYSKELLFNIGDKGDFSYILEVPVGVVRPRITASASTIITFTFVRCDL